MIALSIFYILVGMVVSTIHEAIIMCSGERREDARLFICAIIWPLAAACMFCNSVVVLINGVDHDNEGGAR